MPARTLRTPIAPNRRPSQKKLSLEKARAFWARFDRSFISSGTLKRKFDRNTFPYPTPEQIRARVEPLPITPTILGRVRRFHSVETLRKHIHLVHWLNQRCAKREFDYFEFHPATILSVDRSPAHPRMIEQVLPAPTLFDIFESTSYADLSKKSRYGSSLRRKMRERGVSFEELKHSAARAFQEMFMRFGSIKQFDLKVDNVLLLDYNPSAHKPLISFIDHTYRSY